MQTAVSGSQYFWFAALVSWEPKSEDLSGEDSGG